jgi:hypothetical protein
MLRFCSTCKYIREGYWKGDYECIKNVDEKINFYQKKFVYKKCSEINKNNDCKDYKFSLLEFIKSS